MLPCRVLPRACAQRRGLGPDRELGSALVELAVVLPILLLLFVGTVDFGRIFYRGMAVAQAARAGAEYGAYKVGQSDDVAGIKTAAKNAVASDLTLTDADLTVPPRSCQCATDAGIFSDTSPYACTGNPCSAGAHLVITVNVTATKAFTTVMSYPGIPKTVTITRTTKIRVK